MSFSGNPVIETYYAEAVVPACRRVDLECRRVDVDQFSGRITDRIMSNLKEAAVVIADLTEDRPNCYIEVGIALAMGKGLILQRLNAPGYKVDIPFDIKDYKHILYTTASDLKNQLVKRLRFYVVGRKRV